MTFPVFAPGDILAASDMNAVGLWLVKKQTILSGVSTVTVSDAFSADYDHYRIMISGGAGSTSLGLYLTLGSTVTGYYLGQRGYTFAGLASDVGSANATSWDGVGGASTSSLHADFVLLNPYAADETLINGSFTIPSTTGLFRAFGGYLNNTTSYTAFTITTSTGTITGGEIRVYGFRD